MRGEIKELAFINLKLYLARFLAKLILWYDELFDEKMAVS